MATHMLKLEQYREDYHGPCAMMIHRFVKCCKFLAICRAAGGPAVCWLKYLSLYIPIYDEKEKPYMNTRIYTLVIHIIYIILFF